MKAKLAIVWIRRNMRIDDNYVIYQALRQAESILPIFIFDTTILKRFKNVKDRRLSFIANILFDMNTKLLEIDSKLTVFYGDPIKIVPKLAKHLNAELVFADEDFEPSNIARDEKVRSHLGKDHDLRLYVDHLLLRPDEIVKTDGTPYKKFTPYMNVYKQYIRDNGDNMSIKYAYTLKGKISEEFDSAKADLETINLNDSPAEILKQIGYEYQEDDLWHPNKAKKLLTNFVEKKIKHYLTNRNFPCIDGTSGISPYLRFGVISIRECLHQALPYKKTPGGDQWINELIWREFYVSILYHFPEVVDQEFLPKYRNAIKWSSNKEHLQLFKEGRTGYPIVDAAIRQLLQDGWMHNRCRMIVSSFLIKNLWIDWREGEEFFAQNLMDYDLSSNNGGWQWSASTGTDAQPYFRVFKPYNQSDKYDKDGEYMKKYLPELKDVPAKYLHDPDMKKHYPKLDYPDPIVDYETTRKYAIDYFRSIP